jgi:4-diphosphocytidyl-2C-methyl-D-erythritol kinase
MTGSGPTVFAIFASGEEAHNAAEAFEAANRERDCRVIACKFIYRI